MASAKFSDLDHPVADTAIERTQSVDILTVLTPSRQRFGPLLSKVTFLASNSPTTAPHLKEFGWFFKPIGTGGPETPRDY